MKTFRSHVAHAILNVQPQSANYRRDPNITRANTDAGLPLMKRREFIGIAVAGAAGMIVPGGGREGASAHFAFAHPRLLEFFPEDIVRELGRRYRETVPAENDAAVLTRALAGDASAKPARPNVRDVEFEFPDADLAGVVQHDFAAGRTVILNGWILSLTEARQCALYSLQPA